MEISISVAKKDKYEEAYAQLRKEKNITKKSWLGGRCVELSIALWHKLGKPKDYIPYSVMFGEEEHVFLFNKAKNAVLDPSGSQFDLPFKYSDPRTLGFKSFVRLTDSYLNSLTV